MKSQSRRDFLKIATGTGAGFLAVTPALAFSGMPPVNNKNLGMLYDATKCVGCKTCMVACKRVNGKDGNQEVEKASFDKDGLWDSPIDLSGNTRTIIKLFKEKNTPWSYVKHSCMHCQKASCVSVCPVGALTKDEETGIVDYDKDICIGCRYCQVACPFNIPKFQWDRALPQIIKCNFCKSTNLKEKGIPACVEVCPTEAIIFGTRKELLQEARARIQQNPGKYIPQIFGEKEVGGTNYLFLSAVPFTKLGFPELPQEAPAVFSENIHHTIYKGFIAPIALYATLFVIALRNIHKQEKHPEGPDKRPDGGKH
ncbi:MAG: hydrogenase 2 operon protein HybA [Kiritimatiellae bacterium]|nr:hydrogenase 2 operon protein HybA [Kiritimatiellia bacterium]MDD5521152.1 hydrogenase 2 operon protein HybA [Kiritimatiellia bacterium]